MRALNHNGQTNSSSKSNSNNDNTINDQYNSNSTNSIPASPSSYSAISDSFSSSTAKKKIVKNNNNNNNSSSTTPNADDIASSKIPLPFYIQSTAEEDKIRNDSRSSLTSTSTSMSKSPNGDHQHSIPSSSTTPSSITNSNCHRRHSPIIHNPRVVSISDENDVDDTKYQKTTKLLTQITTICDINVSSFGKKSLNGTLNTNTITTGNLKKRIKQNVHPLLLTGCADGSILLIGYKRAKLLTMLFDRDDYETQTEEEVLQQQEEKVEDATDDDDDDSPLMSSTNNNEAWHCNDHGIHQMMYMYSPRQGLLREQSNNNNEIDGHGRLIILQRNGRAIFFKTKFHTRLNHQLKHHVSIYPLGLTLKQHLQHLHEEKKELSTLTHWKNPCVLPFIHGTFLDYYTVAFLVHPFISSIDQNKRITNETIVQIWHIDDEHNERDRNKKSKILMSELKLNDEQLMDSNHGFLPMKRDNSDGNQFNDDNDNDGNVDNVFSAGFSSSRQRNMCVRHLRANLKLVYKQFTNSLIVQSVIPANVSSYFQMSPHDQVVNGTANICVLAKLLRDKLTNCQVRRIVSFTTMTLSIFFLDSHHFFYIIPPRMRKTCLQYLHALILSSQEQEFITQ